MFLFIKDVSFLVFFLFSHNYLFCLFSFLRLLTFCMQNQMNELISFIRTDEKNRLYQSIKLYLFMFIRLSSLRLHMYILTHKIITYVCMKLLYT